MDKACAVAETVMTDAIVSGVRACEERLGAVEFPAGLDITSDEKGPNRGSPTERQQS